MLRAGSPDGVLPASHLDGGVGCGHMQMEARLIALVRLGIVTSHLGHVDAAAS